MHGTSSSELISCFCNIFSPTDAQKCNLANILSHMPPTPLYIYSLYLPTSKHMKHILLISFHVCITFPALWIHNNSMGPTLSAICSSYTHFPLFPGSACLQMHEMSSPELVSCFCNIFSHTYTWKCNIANILSHTPLLPNFLFIPSTYPLPDTWNQFFWNYFVSA